MKLNRILQLSYNAQNVATKTVKYRLTWNLNFLEDPESSGTVLSGARPFVVVAAAAGVKVAVVVVQPVTVATKHVLEAHHISVLHRVTINSVSGEDLECEPTVTEPAVSFYRADLSVKEMMISAWITYLEQAKTTRGKKVKSSMQWKIYKINWVPIIKWTLSLTNLTLTIECSICR